MTAAEMLRRAAILLLLLAAGACAPTLKPMGPPTVQPRLLADRIVTADGAELPLRVWRPDGPEGELPRGVVIALHGFNDYLAAFEEPAKAWAQAGIVTYAYDQRGFGRAPERGYWPGTETLVADLQVALDLVVARHPDVPVHVLGESMGGAVVLVAGAQGRLGRATSAILVAPAVRGRETINVFARVGLWVFSRTVPWLTGRPAGRLPFDPSDNLEMLRRMSRDPLVIKDTRIDAFWGLVNLMDDALAAAPRFNVPALIQLGANDDLIPGAPTDILVSRLPPVPAGQRRVVVYRDGYHMLLRDLKGAIPTRDVAHWALNPGEKLPSEATHPGDGRPVAGGLPASTPGPEPSRLHSPPLLR